MDSESDFKDLENMIRRNSPFNSSKPLLELDSLTNVLSLFAGSLETPGKLIKNRLQEMYRSALALLKKRIKQQLLFIQKIRR